MNVAEYLTNKIKDLGIDSIFDVPGEYNCQLLKTVECDNDLNLIGCTNALNAGYAADGYARVKGYGAVITNYGTGELSAVNSIAGCFSENVPVIHVAGVPALTFFKDKISVNHSFRIPDSRGYLEMTKHCTEMAAFLTKDNAKIEIDKAIRTLIKYRKPVYIALPEDIALMTVVDKNPDYEWQSDPEILETVTEKILNKIKKSERPLIIADSLIERFDSEIEFAEFVEKSAIPVTNFIGGINSVPKSSNKYLGTYFGEFANSAANGYVNTADCAISVGVIYGKKNTCGMKLPFDLNSQIAIYGTYTYVEGEKFDNIKMSDVLRKISQDIEQKSIDIKSPEVGYEKAPSPAGNLTSDYLYPRLQNFTNETDIIFAESGSSELPIAFMKLPDNVKIHSQTLWSSNGWATPAAFGACIADRSKKVLLITGEGSHLMTAMELGSMLKYGVKPTIIVLNNGGYASEKLITANDSKFNEAIKIDFSKFARSFGGEIWSTKVETADDFDKALRVTKIMDKLCYIETILDSSDIPEITKKWAEEFVNNKTKIETNVIKNKKSVKETEEDKLTLTSAKELNFETLTHKSLSDIEKGGDE